MKKLLILGGTYFQVPAILYAKSKGYYVITCDYLPSNPGHSISDEYHNVSTTDKEGVLKLAKSLNVDGVLCFASDPAAPTAAYVTERLGLPGNPYDKVCMFGEKHLWREFLRRNGFVTPKARSYQDFEEINTQEWKYPVMVKPIDSSGSKGVMKVESEKDLKRAYTYALEYSRAKIIIIEEFVERVGPQIGGDGFFGTDRLDFVCFGDQVVDPLVNPYVPCGMQFPSYLPADTEQKIRCELERAISLSGLRNLSFNLEVMLDREGHIYLMEIGPRNGGNCIPEVICQYTQVSLVALAVESALGKSLPIQEKRDEQYHAYFALHSRKPGIFMGYKVENTFKGEITSSYIFLQEGTSVGAFNGSNETIGILLMRFHTREDMVSFFSSPEKDIHCIIK